MGTSVEGIIAPRPAAATPSAVEPNLAAAAPALPLRAGHIVERIVDGDLVLYDQNRQQVHVLNAPAAFVWQLCEGGHDAGEMAAALAEHFPRSREPIESDVREILSDFSARGLLTT